MRELRQILEKAAQLDEGEKAVLATLVDVNGSSYRLPGARMLMLENGETFGMISGGCLDADVRERANRILKNGHADIFTYDTTNDENSVFSLNMGCRGVIRIFLEPVGRDHLLLENLRAIQERREARTVATLISSDSRSDLELGGRIYYAGEDRFTVNKLPAFLQNIQSLRDECVRFRNAQNDYGFHTFETVDGSFEFAFESIKPPLSLLLFGAGSDAIPLANIASDLGWQVSVFDHRPMFLTSERFADADRLVLHNDERPIGSLRGDSRTVAVIMTHNYEQDARILPRLLKSNAAYIGALGPKRRTEKLLGDLATNGETFTEEQLAKLFAPAGLDIGADTPEAIALAIVAEIQSVLKDRNGGHLRDRKAPIYDRK